MTDLSAALAGIRERYRESFTTLPGFTTSPGTPWAHINSADDIPVLVAALEAVLALAGKLEPQAPSSSALEEDRMWIRQECADMIRAAITTALTGTENGSAPAAGTGERP